MVDFDISVVFGESYNGVVVVPDDCDMNRREEILVGIISRVNEVVVYNTWS